MKSAVLPAMSTITAAEASLINDAEFLEELEQSEHVNEHAPDSDFGARTYADAFDALDAGLPMDRRARPAEVPHHERAPIAEPYEPRVEQPAPAEQRIPWMAAALVLVVCLTTGAATAALVFHDRLTQITAVRPASR